MPESAILLKGTRPSRIFVRGPSRVQRPSTEPPTTLMSQQPFGIFASTLLRFPKLVVAAVNGPAVGVGVTLLPHCDVVYAYGGTEAAASAPAPAGGSSRGQEVRVGLVGEKPADFWTPFFQLAIVPEFCSSVTLPAILVSRAPRTRAARMRSVVFASVLGVIGRVLPFTAVRLVLS